MDKLDVQKKLSCWMCVLLDFSGKLFGGEAQVLTRNHAVVIQLEHNALLHDAGDIPTLSTLHHELSTWN